MPEYTAEADAVGTLRLLDAIRSAGLDKTIRFYQVMNQFKIEKNSIKGEKKKQRHPHQNYMVVFTSKQPMN